MAALSSGRDPGDLGWNPALGSLLGREPASLSPFAFSLSLCLLLLGGSESRSEEVSKGDLAAVQIQPEPSVRLGSVTRMFKKENVSRLV